MTTNGTPKKQRGPIVSHAVLAAVLLVLVAALVPAVRPALRTTATVGSEVHAAASDVVVISEPIEISEAPSIVLQSGRLVAGPRGSGSSRTLVLEEARFTIDLTPAEPSRKPPLIERSADNQKVKLEPQRIAAHSLYAQLAALGFDKVKTISASAIVRWEGGAGIEINELSMELTPRRNGPVSALGTFDFSGEPVEFSVFVGHWVPVDFETRKFAPRHAFAARSGGVPGPLVKATLTARSASISFDGQMAFSSKVVGAVGDVDATIVDPATLLTKLKFAGTNGLAMESVTFRGPMIWRDQQIQSENVTLRVGDQTASGAVVFAKREDRLLVEGTLALDRLDLAPYIAALKSGNVGTGLPSWSATPADIALVRTIDADVRLSTHQLFAGDRLLGRASATFAIRNGKLNADIADLEVPDVRGTMQVNADMMGSAPIYSIRSRFETSDTGWLAEALSLDARIRGKSVCALDLTGTGDTLGALLANARGKFVLKAADGAVVPVNAATLRNQMRLDQVFKGWKSVAGDTKVDEIEIRAQFNKGRVEIERASMSDKSWGTTLSGNIDRTNRTIDARIIAAPSPPQRSASRPARAANEVDRMTAVLRGPLENPRVEPAPLGPAQ